MTDTRRVKRCIIITPADFDNFWQNVAERVSYQVVVYFVDSYTDTIVNIPLWF